MAGKSTPKSSLPKEANPYREIRVGPVYEATKDDMKDILRLYYKFKKNGWFATYGSVKVKSPVGYNPTITTLPDKTKVTFDEPYRMMVSQLVDRFFYFEREISEEKEGEQLRTKMTLAEIEEGGKRPPGLMSYGDMEREFWADIKTTPSTPPRLLAVYGADAEMSFSKINYEDQTLRNIPSLLSHVLRRYDGNIAGINLPTMYFGQWKTTFPWHTEDKDACAINYLHYGDAKFWYTVPARQAREMEALSDDRLKDFLKNEMHECPNFFRHKSLLIDPLLLKDAGITVYKHIQEKGDFIMVDMMSYHAGFNTGINCAEAVNFAFHDWLGYGLTAKLCHNPSINGGFDMEMFIYEYLYQLYYRYLEGKLTLTHPLTNETVMMRPPGIPKIKDDWKTYDSFEHGVVAVLAAKTYEGVEYVLVEMLSFKTWIKRSDLSLLKWHGIGTAIHVPDDFFSKTRSSAPPVIYNGNYLERGVCPIQKTPTLTAIVEQVPGNGSHENQSKVISQMEQKIMELEGKLRELVDGKDHGARVNLNGSLGEGYHESLNLHVAAQSNSTSNRAVLNVSLCSSSEGKPLYRDMLKNGVDNSTPPVREVEVLKPVGAKERDNTRMIVNRMAKSTLKKILNRQYFKRTSSTVPRNKKLQGNEILYPMLKKNVVKAFPVRCHQLRHITERVIQPRDGNQAEFNKKTNIKLKSKQK